MTELEYAILDVEHSFRVLEFATRMMIYCESGHLNLSHFNTSITLTFESESVAFENEHFNTVNNCILASQMNCGVAFAGTAIALDNAFEAVVGLPRKPEDTTELQHLWKLIYAVRNAFAHGIANPKWRIEGKSASNPKVSLNLYDYKTEIDLSKLHGSSFEYLHIGGFPNWLRIKERSLEILGAEA